MNKMERGVGSIKMVRDQELTKKYNENIEKFREILKRYKEKNIDYLRDHEGIITAISDYIKSGMFEDLELKAKYNELIQWKLQNNMRV